MQEIKAELGSSVEFQEDLQKTWDRLEHLSRFPENELPGTIGGTTIGIRGRNQDYESWKVFMIDRSPVQLTEQYPGTKPWNIIMRASKKLSDAPLAFYVEKWSNGLRISSDPVTEEEPYNFDRSVLVPSGSAEFARVPQSSLGELSRLACLVLDKKVKAQSPQDKARVTGYIERIKKTMS